MKSPSRLDPFVTRSLIPVVVLIGALPTWTAVAQSPTALAADLTVPLHQEGLETWAAGHDYKASFHDGFTFYPLLGKTAPRNLPWRFTTTAVVAGAGVASASASPRGNVEGPWRYRYVHDGAWELYDVRPDGVEQSFLIATRPAGDLTIRGRIDSELHCAAVPAAHQALVFRDAQGQPRVRYGEAFAIDADGDRLAIATAFDGHEVSLHVPAAWLARARLPVLVDPLTSAVTLASAAQRVDTCDIGHQSETSNRTVLVAVTRWASATDRDIFAIASDVDFVNRSTLLAQVNAANDDHDPSVAFVAGADRWVICAIRGTSILRTYFHDRDSATLNGGGFLEMNHSTSVLRTVDVGGTLSGTTGVYALCAYSLELAGGPPVRSALIRLNAQTRLSDLTFAIGGTPANQWHVEQPRVNQVSNNSTGNADGWLVVWQQRNILASDDWDLMAVRTALNATSISAATTLVSGITRHVTQPQVAGGTGYYLLTYLASQDLTSPVGARLVSRRVWWAPGQSTFSQIGPENSLATAFPPISTLTNHGLAQNHEISATGVATYTSTTRVGIPFVTTVRAYAARLTTGGAMVDAQTLYSVSGQSAISPAVTFAMPARSYQIAYGTDEVNLGFYPLFGRRYLHPADALEVPYGSGCGLLTIAGQGPYLGNSHYIVSGSSGPASMPAALLVGASSLATPLDAIGMTGCVLNVQAAFSLPGTIDPNGVAAFYLPLPETLLSPYDLYLQIAYASPGRNRLGVQATRGLRAQVR